MQRAPDPLLGRFLDDRFEMLDRIGEGRTGVVYRARQISVERTVAIKVLSALVANDPRWVQRFINEAKACSKLQHPNTVRLIDFGQTREGLLFMAMEFLEGMSVRVALDRQGRMEPTRVLGIVSQCCQSLAEAHSLAIIHRHMKPENVFLMNVGGHIDFVKVLDFSLAKLKLQSGSVVQTQAGLVFGTPNYMSPEQARGLPLDTRSDIYALGIVTYEMLMGRPPFSAENPVEVLAMHAGAPVPALAGVPDCVARIVLRALAKQPGDRQQRVEELYSECAAALAELGAPLQSPSAEPHHPSQLPRAAAPTLIPSRGPEDTDSSANAASLSARPPLGKYRLIAELGRGGMADVYLAVVEGLAGFNKLLVIKVLRNTDDPEFLSMFLDEARLAARLQHPNVVQTYEVGHEGDRYYLAMEFLNGPTLRRLTRAALGKDGLRLPMAVHIVSNILAGLQYAHDLRDYSGAPLGVVHRDLSPHNVMISFDGECKIVDFGIAKVMDASRETRSGVFKGKITYASPEQVRGEKVDRRSDIFSVGVILWESIAGASMWGSLNTAAVAQRLMHGEIPSLLAARPGVPAELARICARALAPALDERYPTAAAFNEDLEAFQRGLGPPVTRRDLSELATTLFDADRRRLQAIIEAQLSSSVRRPPVRGLAAKLPMLGGVQAPTPSDNPIAGDTPAAGRPGSSPGSDPSERHAKLQRTLFSSPPPVPGARSSDTDDSPPRRSHGPTIAAGTVAVVLAAGATFLLFGQPNRKEPAAPLVVEPPRPVATAVLPAPVEPAPPPTPQLAPTPQPAPAPQPAPLPQRPPEVEVRLSAVPASAHLRLDGRELSSNPFSGRLPRDDAWHELVAAAPGYQPMTKRLRFDEDRTVELALLDEPAPPRPAQPRHLATHPAPPAPPTPPTSAPRLDAGEHLPSKPRSKPKRQIDVENPWDSK